MSAARSDADMLRKASLDCRAFPIVPEDGFRKVARPTVVQIRFATADRRREADAPKWRRAPLGAAGVSFTQVVGQPRTHVVQQQVRVRMNGLVAEFGHGMIRAGLERRRVTLPAARAAE